MTDAARQHPSDDPSRLDSPATRRSDPDDPYAISADAIKDPPTTLWGALRQIGPGIILAGSIVGSGELILTTAFGARWGFLFLWLILFSCVIKVFVQIELGRYALSEARPTLAAIHDLPGPSFLTHWMNWWWLVMLLATTFQLGAMVGGVAQALQLAFPGASPLLVSLLGGPESPLGGPIAARPEHPWAILTALAAAGLLLLGGYNAVEKITTAMVVSVTAVTVVCVLALPATGYPVTLGELSKGFSFAMPAEAMAVAFGVFGITGVGASELFFYPYWCLETGYARSVGPRTDDEAWARRARGWMRVMHLDAWVSMLVFTVATVSFYVLGATVLHRQNLIPAGFQTIEVLSEMYVPSFGPWTKVVFLLGAWAVLFKTLYVSSAGNSRLFADFLDLTRLVPLHNGAERARLVQVLCVFFPLFALVLYFVFRDPRLMVMIGGFVQGTMLPLISGAALYLRYYRTDRRLTRFGLFDVCLWVAFMSITVVASRSLFDTLQPAYEGLLQWVVAVWRVVSWQ